MKLKLHGVSRLVAELIEGMVVVVVVVKKTKEEGLEEVAEVEAVQI